MKKMLVMLIIALFLISACNLQQKEEKAAVSIKINEPKENKQTDENKEEIQNELGNKNNNLYSKS